MSISVVTGGSGFIGQHLVDQLLARRETVRILDLEEPPRQRAGVTFIQGSVTDAMLVATVLKGARAVYHTAAIPHLWAPDPAIYDEVNVAGTEIVFEAAAKAGVERVVHTSSSTVLTSRDLAGGVITVDETLETAEETLFGHYARSKWRAEALARRYADRLSIVMLLPTLPLGPGDRNMTPPTRMLRDFVNGGIPAYMNCVLNIVDVRDVAAGHILAYERGQSGQRYILNQHTVDMTVFLRHLEALTGRAMPRCRIPSKVALLASAASEAWSTSISGKVPRAPLAGARMAVRPLRFSSERARTTLGFPTTPLLQILMDAVNWLSEEDRITATLEKSALVFDSR